MISEQTIRTVISICPGWTLTHIYDGEDIIEFWDDKHHAGHARPESIPDLDCCLQRPKQCVLDALAAEGVRVVNALPDYYVKTGYRNCQIYKKHKTDFAEMVLATIGDDETENRLNAIAEFVEKGYLKDE